MRNWPYFFALFCLCLFIYIAARPSNTTTYEAPNRAIQILKRGSDPYHWKMKFEHDRPDEAWWGRFCDGYKPPFDMGMTLVWLRFQDVRGCWFLDRSDLGFKILRDQNGVILMAPNCINHAGPSECIGNEANFEETQ